MSEPAAVNVGVGCYICRPEDPSVSGEACSGCEANSDAFHAAWQVGWQNGYTCGRADLGTMFSDADMRGLRDKIADELVAHAASMEPLMDIADRIVADTYREAARHVRRG